MKKNHLSTSSRQRGLTLIELLIVIAIIAVLAAIIYVAIDPARRLQEARDADRWSSVNSILNAVLKYQVDTQGDLPATGTAIDSAYTTVQLIGTGGAACDPAIDCEGSTLDVAISNCFVNGLDDDLATEYIATIPFDPYSGDAADTRYYINKDDNNRITVGACDSERASAISVTR